MALATQNQTCKLARLLARVVMLWVAFGAADAQSSPGPNRPVTLRIVVENSYAEQQPGRLTLLLRSLNGRATEQRITLDAAKPFALQIAPGRYQLTSERAVQWGPLWAMWDLEVPVTDPVNELRLTSANAITFDQRPDNAESAEVSQTGQSQPNAAREHKIPKPSPRKLPRPQAAVRNNEAPPPPKSASTSPASQPGAKSGPEYIPPPVVLSAPATPIERSIVPVLQRWIQAVEQRDLDLVMSCYAPRLSRYFLQENVSWNAVRQDKQRFFNKYPDIRKLEIRDVRIAETSEGAEARLTKSWEFGGDVNFSGEVVSRLTFENIGGEWLISSEREREIWVRRVVDQSTVADQ